MPQFSEVIMQESSYSVDFKSINRDPWTNTGAPSEIQV